YIFFFFQAEDGIRDLIVTGVQTCALPISLLVALGVNRIRGKMVYRALYFAPVVTSSVAIAVVWQYLLNGQFGVINAVLRGFGLEIGRASCRERVEISA